MMVTSMVEDDYGPARLRRFLRLFALGTGTVFFAGMPVGVLFAHFEDGSPMNTRLIVLLTVFTLAAIVTGWMLAREARKPTGEAPLNAKERLNRNILVGAGLLGVIMGLGMSVLGHPLEVFSDAPLPPLVALIFMMVVGVLSPIMSYVWHRSAVDELEVDAYKTGALYALYVYMLGAPFWWFGWRGGFFPEPNGILIYFATIFTMSVVWLAKKYR